MEEAAGSKRAYNIVVPTCNERLGVALIIYLLLKKTPECKIKPVLKFVYTIMLRMLVAMVGMLLHKLTSRGTNVLAETLQQPGAAGLTGSFILPYFA
ncbi:dolichol-phosphate mannosyltransferase subunit 1 [Panicum miliaceum]|uniref:Dolichol-phosphate mannosyltransferase subunit 1 n=1 Tax=Panicum miliaceum TaxID=4540 RepID=A0A3L6SM55_PANMI|nr:dolichol-phosphate mannosyltransferase subunit 1 [Panicum miliaceum]